MQRKSCKYDSILSEEFYISESHGVRDALVERQNDAHAADCYHKCVLQPFYYFHIAILIQKYINKFVYFLTKIPHLFPFSKKRKMHASSSACISLVNKFCYFTACKFLVNTLTELR